MVVDWPGNTKARATRQNAGLTASRTVAGLRWATQVGLGRRATASGEGDLATQVVRGRRAATSGARATLQTRQRGRRASEARATVLGARARATLQTWQRRSGVEGEGEGEGDGGRWCRGRGRLSG